MVLLLPAGFSLPPLPAVPQMHTGWLSHVRGEAARGAPSPAEQMWLAFVQHLRCVCPHISNSAAFVQWEPHRGCSGGGQQPADCMLGLSVSNPAHTLPLHAGFLLVENNALSSSRSAGPRSPAPHDSCPAAAWDSAALLISTACPKTGQQQQQGAQSHFKSLSSQCP